MGLSDIFNIGNIKKENEELKEMLTPDMNDAIDLKSTILISNFHLLNLNSIRKSRK